MSGYSIKVPGRCIIQLRSIADNVRKSSKIKHPYFPIMKFIEFILPRLDNDFTLAILDKSEMDSNHGITYPDKGIISLREDVYEGAVNGCGRDRMTVAHEFGHYLLHRNVSLFARNMNDGHPLKIIEDSEWQAKCFAGELLVPVRDSRLHNLSSHEIAELCGVSEDAARLMQKRIVKNKPF